MKNPLQTVFNMADQVDEIDIEREYSMTEVQTQQVATQPEGPPVDHKDEDDLLVEKRLDDVYEMAVETFQQQTAFTEVIEPRYAARTAEVAAQYLNIALAAASTRAKVKNDRKRSNQQFVPYGPPGGKTTNNLVIANREDILKMITIDSNEKKM